VNLKTIKSVYDALVYPHLQYCAAMILGDKLQKTLKSPCKPCKISQLNLKQIDLGIHQQSHYI